MSQNHKLKLVAVLGDWAKDLGLKLQRSGLDKKYNVNIRVIYHDHDFTKDSSFPDDSVDVIAFAAPQKQLTEHVLKNCPRVKWVHSFSAGVDAILQSPTLRNSSVPLTNSKGAFSAALAEWAIFSILYFAKKYPQALQQHEEKKWSKFQPNLVGGKTLTIVGFGNIGEQIARAASLGFGMRVFAVKRNPEISQEAKKWVEKVFPISETEEALSESDYVLSALPGTDDTKHFFSEKRFSAMKKGSVFISLGRGAAVDEKALLVALQSHLLGAALDVFEVEPLPKSSPLWAIPRDKLLLYPHCADNTNDAWDRSLRVFEDNLERYASTKDPKQLLTIVNKQLGY